MGVRTAVILAAQRGKGPAGARPGSPRGLVEIAGEPLVERSLRLLRSRGIDQVVIVTGYEAAAYQALARRSPGIELVHNAAFAGTGSMASLAQALDVVEDEFLLLESDLYYEPRALDLLLDSYARDVLLGAGETHTSDQVFIEAPLGRLTFMSKKRAELAFYSAEYVGICRLSRALAEAMRAELDAFVRDHGHARMAYDTDALNALARERHVAVHVAPDLLWGAVDDGAQLAHLRETVAPHMHAREHQPVRTARRVLFSPGPATTSEGVKAALLIADVSPREAPFRAQYQQVRQALAKLAGDPARIASVPLVGSGASALEAMLTSLVGPNDSLLIIDNGDDGTRLGQIASVHGLKHQVFGCGWAAPIDIGLLEARIVATLPRPTHVALVHHEVSSGIVNPVEAVAKLAHKHGALVLVDAISSFGALPLSVGDGGVDGLAASASECLQGIAGVAFVIATRALLERAARHARGSFTLDLVAEHAQLEATGRGRFSVPPQLVSALAQALRELLAEGCDARRARYAQSARALVSGLEQLGFRMLLEPPYRGELMVAVREPEQPWFDFDALHDAMLAQGFTLYPGEPSGLRTFRLSVLGDIDERDIARFLRVLRVYVERVRPAR